MWSHLQKKKEEIQKLIANHRGKSQQVVNLVNEHRVQKKKLESRIEHQSEKICALEAQLSHRITLHEQVGLHPPTTVSVSTMHNASGATA